MNRLKKVLMVIARILGLVLVLPTICYATGGVFVVWLNNLVKIVYHYPISGEKRNYLYAYLEDSTKQTRKMFT